MGEKTMANPMRVIAVHPNATTLALETARWIARLASDAIASRGQFTIALAGGSTPKATYEALASDELAASIAWKKVIVAFGDERAVPKDHADSNYRMANDALLSAVKVPAKNVLRMKGEAKDLDAAAEEYEATLRDRIGDEVAFDLVLLGIGEDGHTASIFPDVADTCRGPSLVTAVHSSSPIAKGVPRLSLTYPTLASARRVAFLAAGANKRAVMTRVLEHDPSLPAANVAPRSGTLCFLLDQVAAP
jgi:6-phosphogluconolactonase